MKAHHHIGYILVQDESCHWYMIESTDRDNFEQWCKDMGTLEMESDFDFSNCGISGPHTIVIYQYEEV